MRNIDQLQIAVATERLTLHDRDEGIRQAKVGRKSDDAAHQAAGPDRALSATGSVAGGQALAVPIIAGLLLVPYPHRHPPHSSDRVSALLDAFSPVSGGVSAER
jgi:hypothetical protein